MKPESDCGTPEKADARGWSPAPRSCRASARRTLEKAEGRRTSAKVQALACLGRKEGNITQDIQGLKTAYSTIRDWLLRMRDRGLKAGSTEAQGARAGLPLQIIRTVRRWLKRSPKKCGFETGSWQMDMVTEMIRKEWRNRQGAHAAQVAAQDRVLLEKRQVRPVVSLQRRQEEFKREVGERAAQRRADGMTSLCRGRGRGPKVPEPRGWRPTGGREQVRTSFSRTAGYRRDVPRRAANKDRGVDELEAFREFLEEIRRDRRVIHGP